MILLAFAMCISYKGVMMLEAKLNEYEKLFVDQFPTYPLMLARTEEQVIETINDCIENGKDVYQMGYLEDSLDILY